MMLPSEKSKMIVLVTLATLLPLALAGLTAPVDLTHYFDDKTLYWTGDKAFNYTRIADEDKQGLGIAKTEYNAAEYGGTYLDTPSHYNTKGYHVGNLPFDRLFGKGVIVDVKDKAAANLDYVVEPDVFEQWEKTNGKFPEGAIVLLNFNWATRSDNKSAYLGTPDTSNNATFHFPGLSESGAKWLANHQVYGVGTDTASINRGQCKEFKAQKVLAEHNIYVIERAALNVTALPASGFRLLALPLKLRQGTGSPVRLVAMP